MAEKRKSENSNNNYRVKISFIDFRSRPDGEYNWALVHENCATKFLLLRPLKEKDSTEVAWILFDIFLTFGIPSELTSNDEDEFWRDTQYTLGKILPDSYFTYIQNRDPEFLASEEKHNAEILEMVETWMQERDSPKWSLGINFVQFQKNTTPTAHISN